MISGMRLPWPVLIFALVFPTAGALVYFVAADPDSPAFRISYVLSKVIQFTFPVVAILLIDCGRLCRIRLSIRGLATGIAVGFLMLAAIDGAYWLALRDTPVLSGLTTAVRGKVAGFGLDSTAGFLAL